MSPEVRLKELKRRSWFRCHRDRLLGHVELRDDFDKHVWPKYRVVSGRGAPKRWVVCLACARGAHLREVELLQRRD